MRQPRNWKSNGRGFVFGAGVLVWGITAMVRSGPTADEKVDYRGTLLVQLRVANLEKSLQFYTDVLDFELITTIDSLKWAELSLGIPGVKLGLGESTEAQGSGTVSLNVGVKDVDAARVLLERRGVKFLRETQEVPGKVRLADFVDPDGNRIRLAQSLASK